MTTPLDPADVCAMLFEGSSEDFVERIIAADPDSPELVVTCNVDQMIDVAKGARLADAYRTAWAVTCDGFPVLRLARALGRRDVARITGADLLPQVCALAEAREKRVVILGGPEGAAVKAAGNLGNHQWVHGMEFPFVKKMTDPQIEEVVSALGTIDPDVVFVCLGSPKQEDFYLEWCDRLPAAIYVGAGAAVDFASGTVRRAPSAVQNIGMEWLWRVGQEPKRLAHRYFVKGQAFIPLAWGALRSREAQHSDEGRR